MIFIHLSAYVFFYYPLYKLRGLSGAVFRACISSFLRRKMIFSPHPRAYNANFSSNARPPVWTEARLWGGIPTRLCQKVLRRKIQMDFSSISGELTGKQVGRGRFVNLQVNEIKRKAK
jgi:hypothetical protein